MKKISLLVLLVSVSVLAMAKGPVILFEETTHDFKTVIEAKGEVKYDFEFKNTGDEDLVINNVRPSCGCTTPEWTKAPIKPGKKGNISVTYNPKGHAGNAFQKSITVTTNASENSVVLYIKGNVVKE